MCLCLPLGYELKPRSYNSSVDFGRLKSHLGNKTELPIADWWWGTTSVIIILLLLFIWISSYIHIVDFAVCTVHATMLCYALFLFTFLVGSPLPSLFNCLPIRLKWVFLSSPVDIRNCFHWYYWYHSQTAENTGGNPVAGTFVVVARKNSYLFVIGDVVKVGHSGSGCLESCAPCKLCRQGRAKTLRNISITCTTTWTIWGTGAICSLCRIGIKHWLLEPYPGIIASSLLSLFLNTISITTLWNKLFMGTLCVSYISFSFCSFLHQTLGTPIMECPWYIYKTSCVLLIDFRPSMICTSTGWKPQAAVSSQHIHTQH